MPNMDGYEATKIIREEERRHGIHTPIIALTAHEMQEDLEKAILIGKDLHITKPIEMKRIVDVVRSVCNTRIRRYCCIIWRTQEIVAHSINLVTACSFCVLVP